MSVDEIKWNSKNTQLQKRRKGEIMEQGKKKGQIKTNIKIVELNAAISVMTLNVSSICTPSKRTVIFSLDKKARFICMLFASLRF